jgi:hypothetical protein
VVEKHRGGLTTVAGGSGVSAGSGEKENRSGNWRWWRMPSTRPYHGDFNQAGSCVSAMLEVTWGSNATEQGRRALLPLVMYCSILILPFLFPKLLFILYKNSEIYQSKKCAAQNCLQHSFKTQIQISKGR